MIQNHHISDSSHPFSVCSSRRTCLFEEALVAHYSWPIKLEHICCCVKLLVIPCVKDTSILHAIHGSINIPCFCDSQSSVLILMGIFQFVRCQRPCDVRIFRLCLVKRQCVESLLFHLKHRWGVPHPSNGPNPATYKPLYISRRYQRPLTLLLRFKAMLTLQTFLYFDHFVYMFPCRLFVQGIWRSFTKNGHLWLLSQRQIGHDQTVPRFYLFVSVHKQTEKLAFNFERHQFYKLHSRQPAVLLYDIWQPLIACSRAGRAGLFIVPCFLHPNPSHNVVVGQMPNSSLCHVVYSTNALSIEICHLILYNTLFIL